MELARILLSAALPTANLLGSWRTLESSQSAGTTSVPPAFYAVATWQLNRCHCGPHADRPCPMAVLKSLPAIDTETKKAARAAFLKIELIRRYRLQGTCHKVHSTSKDFTVLANDIVGIIIASSRQARKRQDLQTCIRNDS
jgi:hypothetical protein